MCACFSEKVFDETFFKKFPRSRAQRPCRVSQHAKQFSTFLFVNFFFAPPISKEKLAKNFMLSNSPFICENLLAAFFFWRNRRKRKKLTKKKSAANGGRCPSTPQAFEKAWPKLLSLCFFVQQKTRTVCAFSLFLVVFYYTFCRAQNLFSEPIRLYPAKIRIHREKQS